MSLEKSVFEDIHIVAKFFLSKAPDGSMNCISRTLGKFSIIDKSFEGEVNDKEVWVCRIVREIKPGQNQGAFVLHPVRKIDPSKEIKKIIPGFYTVNPVGGAALIIPNTNPKDYWVLSRATRKIFSKKYYAVVVPIAWNSDNVSQD